MLEAWVSCAGGQLKIVRLKDGREAKEKEIQSLRGGLSCGVRLMLWLMAALTGKRLSRCAQCILAPSSSRRQFKACIMTQGMSIAGAASAGSRSKLVK